FPHRVTPQRYRQRIDQARSAHMNMLRVWGGGLYEDQAFYDICDETGVLVWQDFCLACACYPEEEPLRTLFEEEARDNVSRLSPHPSLVLWNGNNENIWFTHTMPDFERVRLAGTPTWGLGYYLDLFPGVMAELDPSRPYWPGSPYSGSMDRDPNANEFGNRHIWDVWNGHGDYRNYLGHFPRFASEFGFQGPPTWPTVRDSIPEEGRQWLSPVSHQHNKQVNGQQRALDRIADSFDPPPSYDDQWFLASINQARALTLGCEWFRALSPWCSGALYWQLNDCWPVTSWSAIDGEGRLKLAWYATRRFFRPRLLTIKPAAVTPAGEPLGQMAVYLHNDHGEAWSDRLRVRRMNMAGETLAEIEEEIEVSPRQCRRVPLPEAWTTSAGEFLLADTPTTALPDRAWWFFGRDRDIAYLPPQLEGRLIQKGRGRADLTVTAHEVTRELCVLTDRLESRAVPHEQWINLLPGEQFTFRLDHAGPLTPEQVMHPSVTRSINCLKHYLSVT
ncbi:MAG: glycoside hydrolase family 2 protein, partial [Planctomycetota bacterium]